MSEYVAGFLHVEYPFILFNRPNHSSGKERCISFHYIERKYVLSSLSALLDEADKVDTTPNGHL